jgi:4-hydroxybenzoate-CoA ligase
MSDPTSITDAAALGVPAVFNAASHFIDRHIGEGRAARIAIECGDECVSYGDLQARVNQLGAALRERLAVRPEERVALLLFDGPHFFYSFFGAIKSGAVAVPINTLWTSGDYEYVLADSRARVVIVSEELLPRLAAIAPSRLPSLEYIVVVGSGEGQAPADIGHVRTWRWGNLVSDVRADLDAAATTRDDPAFWLYSSGSTGRPKGCVHLHHDMVVCAELFAKGILGARETDRFFSVPKLFFAYGLGNGGYFPLAVGGTSILWPGPPTAANIYAVIKRHRPTLFFSVPTGYGMLLAQEGEFDLSSVRLGSSAGEALPPALYERFKQRFGVDILDGIGSTEVLHTFISNRPDAIRPGSSGQVVPGYEARLLDESGAAVPRDEIGNLWIAGDSICAGYWNQHEKSKETIHGSWIRTGDKYTQDADGYYWYAGRSDDMLKVGGIWVSPIEVEHALVQHPAVLECAVVGREDRDTLVKPAAFVVVRSGHAPTPGLADELLKHVRSQLADYKRPRWIEFLEELPKTATGKIQRYKLRP